MILGEPVNDIRLNRLLDSECLMKEYGMTFIEVKKLKERERRFLLSVFKARARKQRMIQTELEMRNKKWR